MNLYSKKRRGGGGGGGGGGGDLYGNESMENENPAVRLFPLS